MGNRAIDYQISGLLNSPIRSPWRRLRQRGVGNDGRTDERSQADQIVAAHGSVELVALRRLRERDAILQKTESDNRRGQRDTIIARLDQRIGEHVQALERALTAADEARAAELSADDHALRNVENAGESLDEVSNALVDS